MVLDMKVYSSIEELIGKTPLLKLNNVEEDVFANVYAKLEGFNPAGSVKDRAALYMINKAIEDGLIKDGATIIEPTSGNTGIGLAMIGAIRGFKVVLTMPDTMSIERRKLLSAYGAEVVLTDGKLGMKGAIDKAEEIKKATPNSFIPSQFSNPANPLSHYETTGVEIFDELDGKVDVFVAGIGSGGTISGIGKYLKEKNKKVLIVGVEPQDSPLISKGISGSHPIQGIGANFIPVNFNKEFVDEVLTANYSDAKKFVRLMAQRKGVLVGVSSGASLSVAFNLAKKPEFKDKNIVVLLPDSGERYLSSDLFI